MKKKKRQIVLEFHSEEWEQTGRFGQTLED